MGSKPRMEAVTYECNPCTFWEATHGIMGFDYHEEKYKKCMNCHRRVDNYRDWVEKQGG